jgi:molybdenum cofactor sulfurtransferase
MALKHSFKILEENIPGGTESVSKHTFALARNLYLKLADLKHANGQPLVEVYSSQPVPYSDRSLQGGILTFNVLKSDGSHYGFNSFRRVAEEENVFTRVGCFCNVGACSNALKLMDKTLADNFAAGHVCGDDVDVLNNHPVGAIRISFGWHSRESDVNKVIDILEKAFLKNVKPKNAVNEAVAHVHRIYVYPVKSAAPFMPKSWTADAAGFEYDRNWAVANSAGRVLGQKRLRGLCLLQPHLDLGKRNMTLSYPGMSSTVTIPIDGSNASGSTNAEFCVGRVCGRLENISDCGDEVAAWLAEALGEDGLRLVKQNRNPSKGLEPLTMANSAPYLVINRASVANVAQRLTVDVDEEWLLGQFRANLVLDTNDGAPFDEDAWMEITLSSGCSHLTRHSPCTRCHMVSFDQATGGDAPELRRTLTYMTERGFKFGVLFQMEGKPATVALDDRIHLKLTTNNNAE